MGCGQEVGPGLSRGHCSGPSPSARVAQGPQEANGLSPGSATWTHRSSTYNYSYSRTSRDSWQRAPVRESLTTAHAPEHVPQVTTLGCTGLQLWSHKKLSGRTRPRDFLPHLDVHLTAARTSRPGVPVGTDGAAPHSCQPSSSGTVGWTSGGAIHPGPEPGPPLGFGLGRQKRVPGTKHTLPVGSGVSPHERALFLESEPRP